MFAKVSEGKGGKEIIWQREGIVSGREKDMDCRHHKEGQGRTLNKVLQSTSRIGSVAEHPLCTRAFRVSSRWNRKNPICEACGKQADDKCGRSETVGLVGKCNRSVKASYYYTQGRLPFWVVGIW